MPLHFSWLIFFLVFVSEIIFWMGKIFPTTNEMPLLDVFEANNQNDSKYAIRDDMELCIFLCSILLEVSWAFGKMQQRFEESASAGASQTPLSPHILLENLLFSFWYSVPKSKLAFRKLL